MRTVQRMLTAVLLVTASSTTPAMATTGTCTIDRLTVEGDFPFLVGKAAGVEMPAEFDEASGTLSISRDVYAATFPPICRMGTEDGPPCAGSPGVPCSGVCLGGPNSGCTSTDPDGISADCPDGADFPTIGGVTAWVGMDPGTVTGTIDAGGNVRLPAFGFRFRSGFAALVSLDIAPTLSTGLQAVQRIGSAFVSDGAPLDFSTGQLTVTGVDVLESAPGSPSALASGIGIRCTLSPIPSQAALPAAMSLTKTRGKAKRRGALSEDGGKGDLLVLKMKLAPGDTPPELDAGHPLILRLRAAGSTDDLVLVMVAAEHLVAKGKKRRFKHSDATPFVVVAGRKQANGGDISAALGGKLTLKTGKKATVLAAKIDGLDLTAVDGEIEVALAVDGQTVRGDVTADAKGKLR